MDGFRVRTGPPGAVSTRICNTARRETFWRRPPYDIQFGKPFNPKFTVGNDFTQRKPKGPETGAGRQGRGRRVGSRRRDRPRATDGERRTTNLLRITRGAPRSRASSDRVRCVGRRRGRPPAPLGGRGGAPAASRRPRGGIRPCRVGGAISRNIRAAMILRFSYQELLSTSAHPKLFPFNNSFILGVICASCLQTAAEIASMFIHVHVYIIKTNDI